MSLHEFRFKLTLKATVAPSEDPEKVAGALGKVVGLGPEAASVSQKWARLVTTDAKSLEHVRDQLRDRHIRSAARRQLILNKTRASSSLLLNRQAAAVGVVAVCGGPLESPLGPIYLTLSSEKLDGAIDWLTAYEGGEGTSRVSPS
ncbi:MAG: hypothetical protein KGI26_06220 [Thaumarchaeota archaeon]|nr:hypothetical protein [Nitrososphaerota archaeon]